MAGWLHGVFVVDWLFVFPLCGFSLSLFCNYNTHVPTATSSADLTKPNDTPTGHTRAEDKGGSLLPFTLL